MGASIPIEERIGLSAQCPDTCSADQAFKHWLATEEGERLWRATRPGLSQGGLCNALAHARATRFGLLLTDRGAIIWSRISQEAYTRLAPLYEEAAQTGLCFWYDGVTFIRVGKETFIECIRTLPVPRAAR
jgi:hypothetical protein